MTRRFSRRTLMRASAVGAVGAIAASLGPQLPTKARETNEIPLVTGWNTHTWCGPDTPIHEAVSSLPLRIAHSWDIEGQRWMSYAPDTPVDTIGVLEHGQPLLLQINSDAVWRQPQFRGPLPEPPELPVGWSFVGWSGLHEPVWTALGTEPFGPVAEALRWNSEYQQWISYEPGEAAQQLFAVLHPGDAIWLRMRVAGAAAGTRPPASCPPTSHLGSSPVRSPTITRLWPADRCSARRTIGMIRPIRPSPPPSPGRAAPGCESGETSVTWT